MTDDKVKQARIFLVDDHPLVREWLTNLINQHADLEVCGDAEDVPQALQAIEALQPDVAIIDITLASGSGLELLKDLKRIAPRLVSIVLSMHEENLYAERALRAGARGYVSKRYTTKKIIAAIRQVLSGKVYVSDEFKSIMMERMIEGNSTGNELDRLSDRELDVFRKLGKGMETREIAESLNISIKTVQVYCMRIKEKFHLETANELRREAMRQWENFKLD